MDGTLRLYGNPLKAVFYLAGSLVFVGAGLLLLRDPSFRADVGKVIITYLAMVFFGLGVIVFFIMLLRGVVLRVILQVDALGWTYRHELGVFTQRISWSEVGGVAIYRQQLQRTRVYHLVIEAKHPDRMSPSWARSLGVAFYPSLSRTILSISLKFVFVRVTPAKAEGLLRDIQARFAGEIRGYGITVADEIQEM